LPFVLYIEWLNSPSFLTVIYIACHHYQFVEEMKDFLADKGVPAPNGLEAAAASVIEAARVHQALTVRALNESTTFVASNSYYGRPRHDNVLVNCPGSIDCVSRIQLIFSWSRMMPTGPVRSTALFIRWYTRYGSAQGMYAKCPFTRYKLCPVALQTSWCIVEGGDLVDHEYMVSEFADPSTYSRHDLLLRD
jgi:hypothetical protein